MIPLLPSHEITQLLLCLHWLTVAWLVSAVRLASLAEITGEIAEFLCHIGDTLWPLTKALSQGFVVEESWRHCAFAWLDTE